jgi:hypothetical protein
VNVETNGLKKCNNKITDQIYISGNHPSCGDDRTVELYSLSTGGKILPTKIVGGGSMTAVSIGKSNVANLCEDPYLTHLSLVYL